MKPALFITTRFITVNYRNSTYTILSSDKDFEAVKSLIKDSNYDELEKFLNKPKMIALFGAGDIEVFNECVYYKGQQLHGVIVDKILEFIAEDFPYEPIARFLDNSQDCVKADELYLFLESNESMPITEDGAFLAYRKVDECYMSYHKNPDGTHNRNLVGDIVTMPAEKCQIDRDVTCAEGLHFCSKIYLPNYFGNSGRVMLVKIFPQDVISIPSDYNNAKGRCCKYEVVGECQDLHDLAFKSALYTKDGQSPWQEPYVEQDDDVDDELWTSLEESVCWESSGDSDATIKWANKIANYLETHRSPTIKQIAGAMKNSNLTSKEIYTILEEEGYDFVIQNGKAEKYSTYIVIT